MLAPSFPLNTWGSVVGHATIARVSIERCEPGGFYVHTEESGRIFDSWVETVDDVCAFLATLTVDWKT